MSVIGYHASHEQFSPSQLLLYVKQAEAAGFDAIMTSDHITPWSNRQGNSGNNWAWLGAAMSATSLPFGSLAIPGGWRYHPVVLAHMIATVSEMFPDRLRWIAAGSGEAMNEHVVGTGWPDKAERNQRLRAGCDIMHSLMKGDMLTTDTPWFAIDRARLWSPPQKPPMIFGAALSDDTAEWMGGWTAGLLTVRKPREELIKMINRFRGGGGVGKAITVQLQVSWGRNTEEAREAAWDQWRVAAAAPDHLASLQTAFEFDRETQAVSPEEMDDVIPLVTTAQHILDLIEETKASRVDEIYIHNVSRDQSAFLEFMASQVMPAIDKTS
ncbi:TIGR03885 family FMN-dependent LLM class oxidoreductase [Rhizobium wenxiniae]|uniref:TIGR03885 family FMN-dependent LLM class oxidoreductase n=1 Tax=Rhizobium wenxiniae TaxID=1737357 RepID=UPI001C6E71B0|nr:TIGR03885 family FMN-dependent LLM class oxidoreductase [Rhizobium wenxiniae]MBW9089690.1 TIGR03885 family FMN-dependent LLM class oxidoreductase [Rhizobium wenxiniae]